MSNELYSRLASASLIEETTANTPLTPTTFFGILSEDLSAEYGFTNASPVKNNRSINIKSVDTAIPAPAGTMNINVEPKTFGHFIDGVYGGVTSGSYITISTKSAEFTAGETLLGLTRVVTAFADAGAGQVTVSSTAHGLADGDLIVISGTTNYNGEFTVANKSDNTFEITDTWVADDGASTWSYWQATLGADGNDYQVITGVLGTPTLTEEFTGVTSGSTADLDSYDATVFGHVGTLPDNSFLSYTLQINYENSAIRYMGARFHKIDALGQSDNMITAGIGVIAQGQFRHAKVTTITTAGAGAQTLTVDTTYGLVAADSIKVWRKGTGFLDFSAASTKTHTVGTVATTTTITITNLETSLAVGDLIVLAPQTASYTVGNEFAWMGCSTAQTGTSLTTADLANADIEDFTHVVTNDFEARHAANGCNYQYRFPQKMIQKGVICTGTFKLAYEDEEFMSKLRDNTASALDIKSQGELIGSTGTRNELRFQIPEINLTNYPTSVAEDAVVDEDVPYTAFYNDTLGYLTKMLLINDVANY